MSYAYEQAPARAGEVGKHVGQFRVINGYQLRKFLVSAIRPMHWDLAKKTRWCAMVSKTRSVV